MKDVHAHGDDKNNSILKIATNMAIACIISGIIISLTYAVTNPVAEKQRAMLKELAMQSLIKDADSFEPVEGKPDFYAAVKGGETIGYIVPSESKGYGGAIRMLVAVSKEGTVIDYSVLSMNETPGLGDKGAKEPFKTQFVGKGAESLEVTKDPKNTENIQALTGATITSRAVTKAVKEGLEKAADLTGGK